MRISDWSSDVCSSDLDAHREAGEAEAHQEESARIEPEIGDVAGVHQVDQYGHDEGQGADDVGARLGFGRQGFDLQLQLASATQNVGEVGQRLREVAAGFRLNRQGNREEVELLDVEAAGAVPQHLLELGAQADRVGYPTQLDADRIDDLARKSVV